MVVHGNKVCDYISFFKYLDFITTNSSYSIGHRLRPNVGSIGSVGLWGYLLTVLQFIGFSLGGLLAYFTIEKDLIK